MMSAAAGDKVAHSMKVLEEYAIESSIAKVYGSEMLDYCRGRGRADFRRLRFPRRISGLPRVSRFANNRIFEGTNEIKPHADRANVLMKRAMGRPAGADSRGNETCRMKF